MFCVIHVTSTFKREFGYKQNEISNDKTEETAE